MTGVGMSDLEWLDDILARHQWPNALGPERFAVLREKARLAMRDAGRDAVRRLIVDAALTNMAVVGARRGSVAS